MIQTTNYAEFYSVYGSSLQNVLETAKVPKMKIENPSIDSSTWKMIAENEERANKTVNPDTNPDSWGFTHYDDLESNNQKLEEQNLVEKNSSTSELDHYVNLAEITESEQNINKTKQTILKLSSNNKLFLSFKFIENSVKIDDFISIKVDQTSMIIDDSNNRG